MQAHPYGMLIGRILSRILYGYGVMLLAFGIVWRTANPYTISKRLFIEARHTVPPGGRQRFAKMTETFLGEVGVLLLVFPMLDKFLASGNLPPRYVVYSFVGSLLFYGSAGLLALYTKEEER